MKIVQLFCMVYFATMLTACSLLNLELKSDAVPLTPQQQKMRTSGREFGEIFFTAIEKTSSEIQKSSAPNKNKENAILWKINVEAVAIDAIYKNQPIIAFVDMWALTAQMVDFFETETAQQLFGTSSKLVLATAIEMNEKIDAMAKNLFSKKEYTDITNFIATYIQKHPITDISFQRYPIYTMWETKVEEANKEIKESNKKKSKEEEKAEQQATTVGTLPEVMSDMSDRVATLTRQVQKNLIWQTELLALNGDIDVKQLGKTVDNAYKSSVELKNILINKDASMTLLATTLAQKLYPVVDTLDNTANKYVTILGDESTRFTTALSNQREALEVMIARERASILASIETMRASTIQEVMKELTAMVGNVLWLLIILFAVVLFIPFGVGVFFGRLWKK